MNAGRYARAGRKGEVGENAKVLAESRGVGGDTPPQVVRSAPAPPRRRAPATRRLYGCTHQHPLPRSAVVRPRHWNDPPRVAVVRP